MNKATAFVQAVRTGNIAISEDTAKVFLHITKLEKDVDTIYEDLTANMDDGDTQSRNELFDRIFSRAYYSFIRSVKEEAGRMIARNLEETDFLAL